MDRSIVSASGRSSGDTRGSNGTARGSDNSDNSNGDRPRVMLYQVSSGAESIDDIDDAHSELDVDQYDADVADSWDEQFSIGGDTVGGSILSEPASAAEAYSYAQHQQQAARSMARDTSPQRSNRTHNRHPPRDESASDTSSYERRRVIAFDTASTHSSQQSYQTGTTGGVGPGGPGRRPMGHQPYIRTNFTTQDGGGGDVGTPSDPYEMFGTPPGDPPSTRPDEMPTLEPEVRLPRTMQPWWLFAVIVASFAAGIVGIEAMSLPPEVAYWLTIVGTLYIRAVNCMTLLLAFCQVVVSVATLTTKQTLGKLWLQTLALFFCICAVSVTMATVLAYAMQPLMHEQGDLGLTLSHKKFAFKCPNTKYFEQEPDGMLACRGDAVQANTTFLWAVDIDGTLGLDEAVSTVDFTGYMVVLFGTYVPNNLVGSFAKDKYLSALILATVVGVAVARSFRGLESRSNPLLRLVMHIYASLFSVLDWLQQAVLVALVPQIIGSVLANPTARHIISTARYYYLAVALLSLLHCCVVVPLAFYMMTKRNPLTWTTRVAAPILYGLILQSAFLPTSIATKAVMRTHEVPPAVFGALYPPLAALNRSAQAFGLPLAVMFVASFSGCAIELSAVQVLKLFSMTFIACWGEATLGRSQLAYFLTIWRTVCTNEDTPSAVLAIGSIGFFIYRLSAIVNVFTNLAIVRMIATTKHSKMHA